MAYDVKFLKTDLHTIAAEYIFVQFALDYITKLEADNARLQEEMEIINLYYGRYIIHRLISQATAGKTEDE